MRAHTLVGLAVSCAAVVFERLEARPREWSFHTSRSCFRLGNPPITIGNVEVYIADVLGPADEQIKLHVSLKEQNTAYFEQLLVDISTPDHPKYGEHLDRDEVDSIIRPHDDTYRTVRAWLEINHVYHVLENGDMIAFYTNVSNAERMLSTKFAWYLHNTDENRPWEIRTTEYSLPPKVAGHVNFIHPTIKFPTTQNLRSTVSLHTAAASEAMRSMLNWQATQSDSVATVPPRHLCGNIITPQCLLSLYNVHYGPMPGKNTVAFASFLREYARYTDLSMFEDTQTMYTTGHNFSVVEFNGGLNDQSSNASSTEANLDCQYLIALAYPIPVLEYSTAGCGPVVPDAGDSSGSCINEPYIEFLQGILKLPNSALPQTLSISYGEDEQSWPQPMAVKVCGQLAQLGSRGVSVIFASGDSSPGGAGGYCENNEGTAARFVPGFPASCPYVTAVGATHLISEQATSFSGGGFSNYFARPSYQNASVSAFLAKETAFSQYYNKSGRGYPDVSAQGVNFIFIDTGTTEVASGTSAAAPTFASIVALLNAARVTRGEKVLGFLNPAIYAGNGVATFSDITAGRSRSCTAGSFQIAGAGFKATTGWDPVTGLGTPDFGKLLAYLVPGVLNTGGTV